VVDDPLAAIVYTIPIDQFLKFSFIATYPDLLRTSAAAYNSPKIL